MLENQKKVHRILNIFQEGIFESLHFSNGDLNFKLECSFLARFLENNSHYFYGVFKGCKDIYFTFWEEDQFSLDKIEDIENLKLYLMNTETSENGYFKIYCNSNHLLSGGNLFLKVQDLKIFNEEFEELTLHDLNNLAEKHWYHVEGAENLG